MDVWLLLLLLLLLFIVVVIAAVVVVVVVVVVAAADRLVGLVVKASTSRTEGPGFESRLRRDFFGVESYQ